MWKSLWFTCLEGGSLYVVGKDLCSSAVILKTLRLFMYVQPIYV